MADRNEKKRKEYADRARKSIQQKTERIHAQEEKRKEERRQGRKPKYTSSKAFAYKLAEYFVKCNRTIIDEAKSKTEPYTLTGIQIALGLAGSSYQSYKHGEKNYIIDEHTVFTGNKWIEKNIKEEEKAFIYDCQQDEDIQAYFQLIYDETDISAIYFDCLLEKARQIVAEQAEQRLYINGRVADIFTMKSKHGWQEENRTVHRLEIATDEQAKKALEDLRLLDD